MSTPPFLRLQTQPSALPSWQQCEVVERKGVGHPDTLADGIAELTSIRYSQYCLREFGAVLHHNLDKVAVLGAQTRFSWSDGEFRRPVRVVFAGRASQSFGGEPVPLIDILESAAREQLERCLPIAWKVPVNFAHETTDSSKFSHWFRPQSLADLPELPHPRSNDTALLVGVAPCSRAELSALAVESYLSTLGWTGSDIKVLVIRDRRQFRITVCAPAVVGTLGGPAEYREAVAEARASLAGLLARYVNGAVDVRLNTGEVVPDNTPAHSGYVSLSGSAIDFGEDGLVGRGNGRNGLITPAHQAGNEALFGKNPAYHVGKVGGLLADRLTHRIAGLGVGCRIALVYDRGACYSQPAWCQVDTSKPLGPVAAEEIVDNVLTEGSWYGELLDQETYRPRIQPLDGLLDQLRSTDA